MVSAGVRICFACARGAQTHAAVPGRSTRALGARHAGGYTLAYGVRVGPGQGGVERTEAEEGTPLWILYP